MKDWHAETIFCDDIRIEENGKHILIGVYGVDLVPALIPVTIQIGIWVRFWGLAEGRRKFKVRLLDPSDREAASFDGDTEIARNDAPTIFSVSGLSVGIEGTGEIVVQFAFDNEDLVEIGRLKVSPPPGSAQPFASKSS